MKIVSNCTKAIGALTALGTIKTPEGLRMLFISSESDHYLGRKCRTWSLEVRKEDGTVEDDGRMCFHGMIWAGPNKVELSLTRKGRTVSSKHHRTVWQGIADAFIAMVLAGQPVGEVVDGECQFLPAEPVEVELPFDAHSEELEDAVSRAQEYEEEQETGRTVTDADFPAYRNRVGQETVRQLNSLIGYDLLTFKSTTSPDDYMTGTDKLYATIPRLFAGKLHHLVIMPEPPSGELSRLRSAMLSEASKVLSPRSGFIPFYSTNPLQWPAFHDLPASLWGIIMRGWLEFLHETKGQGTTDTLADWLSQNVVEQIYGYGIADEFIEYSEAEEG